MSSSRSTLTAFTDAAADAVARAIAEVQREAARERELREAQFAAAMALLEARIASVTEIEKRMADRLESLKDGEPGRSVTVEEVAPLIEAEVARRVAEIPAPKDGDPGKDADPDLIERMVADAVAAVPPAKPGRDADEEAIFERLSERLSTEIEDIKASIPAPPELPDIPAIVEEAVASRLDADDLERSIETVVRHVVAEIPVPKDGDPGKDADPELVAALVEEKLRAAVEALPPPEKGDPGPVGSLPVVRGWEDRVYYQGEVVSFDGSLFQSTKDTGKSPEHEDWVCIVAKGKDGENGRSPTVRGTYDPDQTYSVLDVVALNGASFVAKSDGPGPCPGEGWQLMAMQGKQGKPGLPGKPGTPGIAVTASLKNVSVSSEGVLTFKNADGTEVQCDLYPLLSKIGGG